MKLTNLNMRDKRVESLFQKLTWHDIRNTDLPMEVHGLYKYADRTLQDGNFVRMDPLVAKELTKVMNQNYTTNGNNIWGHNQDTSGGRVRFSTDSRYVAVRVLLPVIPTWGNHSGKENVAVDVYVDTDEGTEFAGTVVPETAYEKSATNIVFEGVIDLGSVQVRDITVYMPILNPVKEFYVGLEKTSMIGQNSKRYKKDGKMVWYGSSLTEGGSVSHPGNTYAAIVARAFHCDFTNLGMWGSAKGQDAMARYIAKLDMSMFVLDYDHNESDVHHLKTKHWNFYQTVRAAHPNIPILFISRPNHRMEAWADMRAAIQSNYHEALSAGDNHVYFVDGQTFFAGVEDYASCFVDGVHHTDQGAELIARALIEKLEACV